MTQTTKRAFSSGGGQSAGFGRSMAIGAAGVGTLGLTYLSYMAHHQRMKATPEMRLSLFDPRVQAKLRSTFAYFGGACGMTGAMVYALRNSSLVHMNPLLLFAISIGSMFGTRMIDYDTNWALKNCMYTAFIGSMSISLLPLIHMYQLPVIYDALIATGVTMGGLSAVAYNAPSEQFLSWGGPLACGLGCMIGVSLLRILYPASPALTSMYLYGGIGLFSAFVLYDVQKIIYRCKTEPRYNPIDGSIGIYLDAINLFTLFVQLLGGSKRK